MVVPYLLHEDPVTLLPPTNQPRVLYEKIQLINPFWLILDEDVTYSIVVENITVKKNKGYVQSACSAFKCYNIYINIFLRISDKCKVLSEV